MVRGERWENAFESWVERVIRIGIVVVVVDCVDGF